MPRWASRLTLTVTEVRRQRLQDIDDEDARAEGLEWVPPTWGISGLSASWSADPIDAFAELWHSIHGGPARDGVGSWAEAAASWDANPEVVALTFTVERS